MQFSSSMIASLRSTSVSLGQMSTQMSQRLQKTGFQLMLL